MGWKEKILEKLSNKSQTIKELIGLFKSEGISDVKDQTIRTTINRLENKGLITKTGKIKDRYSEYKLSNKEEIETIKLLDFIYNDLFKPNAKSLIKIEDIKQKIYDNPNKIKKIEEVLKTE